VVGGCWLLVSQPTAVDDFASQAHAGGPEQSLLPEVRAIALLRPATKNQQPKTKPICRLYDTD